jgi:hypothetical protein
LDRNFASRLCVENDGPNFGQRQIGTVAAHESQTQSIGKRRFAGGKFPYMAIALAASNVKMARSPNGEQLENSV